MWTLVTKPTASASALSGATSVNPSFTPDVDGNYVIRLVVNDGTFDSIADTVTITATAIANNPPTADAGSDQNVATGSLVTLDGSNSSDLDGDTLSCLWAFQSKPSGSLSILSSTTLFEFSIPTSIDLKANKTSFDTFIAKSAVNTRYIMLIIFCLGVNLPPAIIFCF